MKNRLLCIVTGMEHSGTTFLLNNLKRLEGVSSGFEVGVLLANSPRRFFEIKRFYSWMTGKDPHWELTQEQLDDCCETDDFGTFYDRLAGHYKRCQDSDRLVDKTPKYVYHLDQVMAREFVPVLITVRDICALYVSHRRRMSRVVRAVFPLALWVFCRRYLLYRKNVQAVRTNARVMLIGHQDLTLEPNRVLQQICEFLDHPCRITSEVSMKGRPLHEGYDIQKNIEEARRRCNFLEKLVLQSIRLK